jgi:hypothetical protein
MGWFPIAPIATQQWLARFLAGREAPDVRRDGSYRRRLDLMARKKTIEIPAAKTIKPLPSGDFGRAGLVVRRVPYGI